MSFIFASIVWKAISANDKTRDSKGDNSQYARNQWSKKYSHRSTESQYKSYVLQLLAATMNANGKNMVCELDRVKDAIKRYYKTEEDQKEALAEFREYLSNKNVRYENVASAIGSAFDKQSCTNILTDVLAVVFADGEMDDGEFRVMKAIANGLGFGNSSLESIFLLFVAQKKCGVYGDSYLKPGAVNDFLSRLRGYNYGYDYKRSSDYGKRTSGYNKQGSGYDRQSSDYNRQQQSTTSSVEELERAYKILKISSSATNDEVTSVWKKNVRKWHPDLFESQGEEAVRKATENTKIINQAYETICKSRGMQ